MNYKKIKEDFDNGLLVKGKASLMMDNDDRFLVCIDESLDDEELDEITDELGEKCGRSNGECDTVKVLNEPGIPAFKC